MQATKGAFRYRKQEIQTLGAFFTELIQKAVNWGLTVKLHVPTMLSHHARVPNTKLPP